MDGGVCPDSTDGAEGRTEGRSAQRNAIILAWVAIAHLPPLYRHSDSRSHSSLCYQHSHCHQVHPR